MLDADLAKLYGVETKYLNKAVGRNIERFPFDFMFRLTMDEWVNLRFQIGTSRLQAIEINDEKEGRGGRRYTPFVFTQEGVAMLSGVLKSQQAILVNVEIMRSFVRLRSMAEHTELARKITRLEKKYDHQFKSVFDALRELMSPRMPRRKIGFHGE